MKTAYEREVQYGNIYSCLRHITTMAHEYESRLRHLSLTKENSYQQLHQLQTIYTHYESIHAWLLKIEPSLHAYNIHQVTHNSYRDNNMH